jgi:hypothetical protein
METIVPAGTVTPLENVNGRNARRVTATGKMGRAHQYFVIGKLKKEQTEAQTINPLGLSEETVYPVHFVYPSFRPTIFCNHSVDLFTEGFDIFRVGKKTVQYLRERLLACSD